MSSGKLHLYWGNGKGKTTAAMGLALRALGHNKLVVIVQLLKRGYSGEVAPLRLAGATVLSAKQSRKFLSQMDAAERAALTQAQNDVLRHALSLPCDLLILDEACAACESGTVSEALLREAAERVEDGCEVVFTGREPAAWMHKMADYSTQMVPHAHPFSRGITAREGIEF